MMNEVTRTAAAGGASATAAATGDPRVDEALARLANLDGLPDSGHVEAFEQAYVRLRGLLDELATAAPRGASGDASDGQAQQA
ncbi:MAG TPA: hypothetical protein VLW50_05440 [Streptosporangiaceae bacterium]|nr:hypothetical protein [Streptosporangiaceae bacterium]